MMMVDFMPDDMWLEIFDFDRLSEPEDRPWEWARLVHICQKWRRLIFASPLHLKLRILCKTGTRVRENLGIWPAFPILMHYDDYRSGGLKLDDEDNVIAALEHPNRLYRVCLDSNRLPLGSLGKIIAMMQKPCPILTCLSIATNDRNSPVLPAGFLGGSAPCLQQFRLCSFLYPALPTLLLPASDLVDLTLSDIPLAGYISPEAMAGYLATFSRLKTLHLRFQTVTSQTTQILPPPIEQSFLPSLHKLIFSGVFEYMEDFVVRIDAPWLDSITIDYLDQGVDFEVPRLSEFLNHSENLKKTLSNTCKILLSNDFLYFDIFGGATTTDKSVCWDSEQGIYFQVRCKRMDRKILQLTNVLSWISPIISDIVHFGLQSDADIFKPEDVDWMELLHQFPSVQTMFIYGSVTRLISLALDDIAEEMLTEVLPALDFLGLEDDPWDKPPSSVHKYLAFCKDEGHQVTFVKTWKDFTKLQSCR
jgi:hypothetical protein